MRRAVCLSLLVAFAAGPASAQSRAETERRLTSLRSQIEGVERQVRSARGEEASALRAVEAIGAEIQLREELVSGYRGQIGTIRQETQRLRRSIERLETEIGSAKQSYRTRARHAYIHGRRNGLALVLAAGSVNQMLVRARYLQQFASRRRGQVEQIAIKTSEMRSREQTVRASLEETQRVLQQGQAQQTELAQRRRDRETLVTQARSRRGRLERELAQRQADASELSGLVRELVAQERQRAQAQQAAASEAEGRRNAAAAAERERVARAEEAREREAARQAEAARIAAAERRREAEAEEVRRAAAAQRAAQAAAARAAEAEALRTAPTPRREDPAAVAEAERRRAEERRQADARAAAEAEASRRAEAERVAAADRRRRAEQEEAARVAESARIAQAQREAEVRRAAEAAAAPASRTVDLTGSFRSNRGRLRWPSAGTVTGRFGTRTDPVSGTRISSPGIDISTAPGAPAVSVFEGVVQRVGRIPTYGQYVMVTHGEFVTLYGNLSQVSVRQGQSIRAGQAIGRAGTASERRGSALFFALYQGGSPSDPTGWLERR